MKKLKQNLLISLVAASILLIFLSSCGNNPQDNPHYSSTTPSEPEKINQTEQLFKSIDFKIIDISDYNKTLCTSTARGGDPNAASVGVKLKLVGSDGKILNGSGTMHTDRSASGISTRGYSCYEKSQTHFQIEAFAKGYSPVAYDIDFPRNKTVTVEIQMAKSCTTGPSCFDNAKVLGKNVTWVKEYILKKISDSFNITPYEFKCLECNIERGGFIKGIATTPETGDFEFYHRWGWCSSGGADCSDTRCLSTPNTELYTAFKEYACANIYSRSYFNETTNRCSNTLVYDNTTELRQACVNGLFSEYRNGINSISLMSAGGRCTSYAKKMNTNCLEN